MSKPMDPDRWARVDALFDQASRRPAHERAAFLARACQGDDALRREVESLLAAGGGDVDRRIGAVGRVADRLWSGGAAAVGQRLGAYRLAEEIGRGGMGVVYRAVRDRDDFQHTVAVKVLPGALFSRKAMARFRNERSILAGLQHPNIARLLDGGATPDGIPYVIMEYVDGRPVDRYCEQTGLGLDARVRLFLTLCDAVQYAHRHLVVHRDLKPSNVLVTDEGVLKLLDFGIAKLVDPDEGAGGEPTALTQSRIMTPRFASPEQLTGDRIATPSDVYSLGVILHCLLTGAHPYEDAGGMEGADAGPMDLVRRVLEGEPRAPSEVAGDARLKGDLDLIVLKALRRDVRERYESVQALADDLRLYLARRPITARPLTWSYRTTRFVSRNRAAVLGGTVAALLVMAQSGILLRRLAHERDAARAEAARATAALDLLADAFRAADGPGADGRVPTAVDVLERGVAGLADGPVDRPEVRAEMLDAIGLAYANLGVMDSAQAVLERGVALRDSVYGPQTLEAARGLHDLGRVLARTGRVDRADSLLQRALDIRLRELPGDHPDVASLQRELAEIRASRQPSPSRR